MRLKILIALVAVLWLSGCQPKLLEDGNGRVVDVSQQATTVSRIQYYRTVGLVPPGGPQNAAFEINMIGNNQNHIHGLDVPDPQCFSTAQISDEQKAGILTQIEDLQTISSADVGPVPADATIEYIEVTYLDQHTSRIYLAAYNLTAQYLVAVDGSALSQSLQDLASQLSIACE